MQAYEKAIKRAVRRLKEEEGEVHALDLGCGAGLFSVMAAKAGATSVVACDMHEPLCIATRKVVIGIVTPQSPKEPKNHRPRVSSCRLENGPGTLPPCL